MKKSPFEMNSYTRTNFQRKRKISDDFIEKLLSVEQNFSVFRYSENHQGNTEYNTAQSSFYPQSRDIIRQNSSPLQNNDLLSNLYLLPQSLTNRKKCMNESKYCLKKMNFNQMNQYNIIEDDNTFLSMSSHSKGIQQINKDNIFNPNYQIQTPKLNGYKFNQSLKKNNSNGKLNNSYYNNNPIKNAITEINQQNQSQLSFKKQTSGNYFIKQTKMGNFNPNNSTLKEEKNLSSLNEQFRNSEKMKQMMQQNSKLVHLRNPFNKRISNLSRSSDNFKIEENKIFYKSNIINKQIEQVGNNEKEKYNENGKERQEEDVTQKSFNEIVKSLRYGKINEHKQRIFREMKKESVNNQSKQALQFNNQASPPQPKDSSQSLENGNLQKKSSLSKTWNYFQTIGTLSQNKPDNYQTKTLQMFKIRDLQGQSNNITQKQKMLKSNYSEQKRQSFFNNMAILDKSFNQNQLIEQKEHNEIPKQCLQEIQDISKQLNIDDPKLYDPFGNTHSKNKFLFSNTNSKQQEEDQDEKIQSIQKSQQNLNQDINNKPNCPSRNVFLHKIQSRNDIQNRGENNKQGQITSILCKYINKNMNLLSKETKLLKPTKNVNIPINLESCTFLKKFLPNFNQVERSFAYNENNLQKNSLVLEKVLLERIVKKNEESQTENLDLQINKKGCLLLLPVGKKIACVKQSQNSIK